MLPHLLLLACTTPDLPDPEDTATPPEPEPDLSVLERLETPTGIHDLAWSDELERIYALMTHEAG